MRQVAGIADLPVLNTEVVKPIAADPAAFHVNNVFPLVCLGVQFEQKPASV
jgi:hypothetical protein